MTIDPTGRRPVRQAEASRGARTDASVRGIGEAARNIFPQVTLPHDELNAHSKTILRSDRIGSRVVVGIGMRIERHDIPYALLERAFEYPCLAVVCPHIELHMPLRDRDRAGTTLSAHKRVGRRSVMRLVRG